MEKSSSIKIGIGAGAVLLGLYLILSNLQNTISVIGGIIIAAFGIGLLASN